LPGSSGAASRIGIEFSYGEDHISVTTTVLIVDDHPSFRATARMLLEAEGYDVVGEAPDGASAIEAAGDLRPDIVLLDVNLPDTDGFAVAERITGTDDAPVVVLVSSRDPSDFGPLVAASGARGFIPKGELSGAAIAALM
jgi:DNA-binding NarL/FixJ family response regulator